MKMYFIAAINVIATRKNKSWDLTHSLRGANFPNQISESSAKRFSTDTQYFSKGIVVVLAAAAVIVVMLLFLNILRTVSHNLLIYVYGYIYKYKIIVQC